MHDKPVYVTEEGKAGLEEELRHLQEVERPRIIDLLHEVKSGGDWMENTEQMIFEDELAFIDGRILELEGMLADSRIIEPDNESVIFLTAKCYQKEGRIPLAVETLEAVDKSDARSYGESLWLAAMSMAAAD